jgi:hypothetical protein
MRYASAHRTLAGKAIVAATLLFAVVTVRLYLYSPWHQHQLGPQGRQTCAFNTVEQSDGLEASSHIVVAPPPIEHDRLAEAQTTIVAGWHFRQRVSRAPPA